MSLSAVLRAVTEERQRQDKKWGQQNHRHPVWMLILAEEVGEVAKEALEREVEDQAARLMNSTVAEVGEVYVKDHLRDELIQVAAVAIAWVECIDRNAPVVGHCVKAEQPAGDEL